MTAPLFAAQLTWPEVKALSAQDAIALLPVGSTEAHGPHLPLNVDVVIAEEVCRRVSARLARQGRPSLIFPALTYSLTEFAADFAGTVGLSADVARRCAVEVLAGIARHGFRRIGVINHHVEPAHFQVVHQAVKEAAEATGATILAPDHRRRPVGPQLGDEFMHGGSHAGLYETSLVLAAAPELVREDARAALPELKVDLPGRIKAGAKTFHACGGPDAYFGAPAQATRAEGERLYGVLVEATVAALLA